MFHHDGATVYAARRLIDRAPADRLDAFLHLAAEAHLWRGADCAEAVRRYEATTGRALPRVASLPAFGAVRWRADEGRSEVGVSLDGRFLGRLASPSRGRADAGDWQAEARLFARLGIAPEMARIDPPRMLLDAQLCVIELARVHVVERGTSV